MNKRLFMAVAALFVLPSLTGCVVDAAHAVRPDVDSGTPSVHVITPAPTVVPVALDADEIAALTVTTVQPRCVAYVDKNGLLPFEIQARPPYSSTKTPAWKLLWSDSVGPQLPISGQRAEIERRICKDPLSSGPQLGHYFATRTIAGTKLIDVLPRLKKWEGDAMANAKQGASYVPLYGVKSADVSQTVLDDAVKLNQEWQDEASFLLTLLDYYTDEGMVTQTSTFNYAVLGGGLARLENGLPVIGPNPESKQDSRSSFKMTLVTKNGSCEAIAWNMGDGRLMGLPCTVEGTGSTITRTYKPNPKPTTTPAGCPTGTTWSPEFGKCLTPKSSNPKDYKTEAGAPKATVTEKASTPSKVDTKTSTGQSATDTPGSEVVTAPQPAAPSTPAPAPGANTNTSAPCAPAPGETSC